MRVGVSIYLKGVLYIKENSIIGSMTKFISNIMANSANPNQIAQSVTS